MPQKKRPAAIDFVVQTGVLRRIQQLNIWLFRKTNGRIGGSVPFKEQPICLLTTIGRKSGQPRTVALLYLDATETEAEPRFVLVASKGGTDKDPLWYRNLEANPHVEVEVRGATHSMLARDASADERAGYWPRLVEMYKGYEDYQAWTDRKIPLVILTKS